MSDQLPEYTVDELRAKWADLVRPDCSPRTPETNARIREQVIQQYPHITEFTCDGCQFAGAKEFCPFIYDPYNTQGDCLALK